MGPTERLAAALTQGLNLEVWAATLASFRETLKKEGFSEGDAVDICKTLFSAAANVTINANVNAQRK